MQLVSLILIWHLYIKVFHIIADNKAAFKDFILRKGRIFELSRDLHHW